MEKGQKQEGNICVVCGVEVSEVTAAKVSHMRKHVKDGSVKETKGEDGKLMWITTGNDPQDKSDIKRPTYRRPKSTETPRIPSKAKSDKKGKIHIQCKTCNKYNNNTRQFADQRFISIVCCDQTTIFPQRMVETLINNPGREYLE